MGADLELLMVQILIDKEDASVLREYSTVFQNVFAN
jgi:hypothetical protein